MYIMDVSSDPAGTFQLYESELQAAIESSESGIAHIFLMGMQLRLLGLRLRLS